MYFISILKTRKTCGIIGKHPVHVVSLSQFLHSLAQGFYKRIPLANYTAIYQTLQETD